LTREVVGGALYPYTSDKTNTQKSEISMFTAAGEPIDGPLV
jgi:hypothetical protein